MMRKIDCKNDTKNYCKNDDKNDGKNDGDDKGWTQNDNNNDSIDFNDWHRERTQCARSVMDEWCPRNVLMIDDYKKKRQLGLS